MSASTVGAPQPASLPQQPAEAKHAVKPHGASFESLVNGAAEKKPAGPVTPTPRSYETI